MSTARAPRNRFLCNHNRPSFSPPTRANSERHRLRLVTRDRWTAAARRPQLSSMIGSTKAARGAAAPAVPLRSPPRPPPPPSCAPDSSPALTPAVERPGGLSLGIEKDRASTATMGFVDDSKAPEDTGKISGTIWTEEVVLHSTTAASRSGEAMQRKMAQPFEAKHQGNQLPVPLVPIIGKGVLEEEVMVSHTWGRCRWVKHLVLHQN
ncbi:hypothetical protein ZEAMMB73_Zm00001d034903 [Zea mays]|uniref:Uncharacterized protein n=1 Tax=Zea mays TaxID=4577 RepID=A0A1D6LC99_MAIZE|nr:hypothetical protein ZEAMMB73_Zm00001d034903 [Zea mays]ONM11717.1 hypothetical protein ZEAMMB73_Zm00001d034903 [Zea mays]